MRARAHTPQQLSAACQFHISQYSPSRAGPPGAGGKSEAAQWCKEGHTGARGGGLWTSGLARSGSGPACPGEVGAPRSGPHPFPCPQRPSPSLGPGAPGQGPRQGCWLAAGAGGQGRPLGLPLSQEPAAAAPTGHRVISKVNHTDAPPAAFRPGPRPLALVPTHTRFSGSWSRTPRHVQPSSLGWITCSRATCHCPSACLPSCHSRSRRGPSGVQPWAGSPQESLRSQALPAWVPSPRVTHPQPCHC